ERRARTRADDAFAQPFQAFAKAFVLYAVGEPRKPAALGSGEVAQARPGVGAGRGNRLLDDLHSSYCYEPQERVGARDDLGGLMLHMKGCRPLAGDDERGRGKGTVLGKAARPGYLLRTSGC